MICAAKRFALCGCPRPGPRRTTSASDASSSTRSAPATASSPSCSTGSPTTKDSGSATARVVALSAAVATCTLPAPTRSAASAASSTAPGVCRAPPTTSTVPRSDLSPPGSGSRQPRRSPSSTRTGCSSATGPPPLRGSRRFGGGRLVGLLDGGEGLQLQTSARAPPVAGQGAVGERLRPVQVEQRRLVEALEGEAEAHDDGLVGEDPDTAACLRQGKVKEEVTHPEGDVGPALAAGRTVVELAEPGPSLGLLGMARPDPRAGEPVEDPEVTLAQPFVPGRLHPDGLGDDACRAGRPEVRRAEHDVGAARLGRGDVLRQHRGLSFAALGERRVGVSGVEVEMARTGLPGPGIGDVADALTVADQDERVHRAGERPGGCPAQTHAVPPSARGRTSGATSGEGVCMPDRYPRSQPQNVRVPDPTVTVV